MNVRRFLVLIVFSALTKAILGETSPAWYSGSLVLATQEVLLGEISTQLVDDLILFKKDASIYVYPAHRVQAVYFYDADANVNRKYVSVRDDHALLNVYHLYEIVVYGNVCVLRKQKKVTALQQAQPSDRFDFDYYITLNDHLISLLHFRNKIYPALLRTSAGQVDRFINEHKLDPNLPDHAIRIIDFYNKVIKANSATSYLRQFQAAKYAYDT